MVCEQFYPRKHSLVHAIGFIPYRSLLRCPSQKASSAIEAFCVFASFIHIKSLTKKVVEKFNHFNLDEYDYPLSYHHL